MRKITSHLWFDTQAQEAAAFYTSIFPDSKVRNVTTLHDTPSGDCDVVSFTVWGHEFQAISAGPHFKFNPSISFMVNFDPARDTNARELLDAAWSKLSDGGTVMMPLDTYPFSERYGWIQDRYGLSWQLILSDPSGDERPAVIPSLLFVGEQYGKAEEAVSYYLSVFKDSKRGLMARYPAGMEPDKEGTVMFSDFQLFDTWFAAMDSAREHGYAFNEAISLVINCDTQEELEYYWNSLSAVPEAEQCGWLKDKFGVSWQVVPSEMQTLLENGTRAQVDAMTQAFLPMKKLDMQVIKQAYDAAAK